MDSAADVAGGSQRTQMVMVSDKSLETELTSETESLEGDSEFADGDNRDGASEVGFEDDMMEESEVAIPRRQVVRGALELLDEVDLRTLFSQRASLMKNIPRFLVGPYRNAMRVALAAVGGSAGNQVLLERGWKLFLLLPRMLLHRPPRGGLIAKSKLADRFDKFQQR